MTSGGVADLMRRNLLNYFEGVAFVAAELNGKAGQTVEVGDAARFATDRCPGRRPLADDRLSQAMLLAEQREQVLRRRRADAETDVPRGVLRQSRHR